MNCEFSEKERKSLVKTLQNKLISNYTGNFTDYARLVKIYNRLNTSPTKTYPRYKFIYAPDLGVSSLFQNRKGGKKNFQK